MLDVPYHLVNIQYFCSIFSSRSKQNMSSPLVFSQNTVGKGVSQHISILILQIKREFQPQQR